MSDEKRPKGILKSSSSFDKEGHTGKPSDKGTKWDEMNILATYHPADKDYGHKKIDEPPTPYNRLSEGDTDDGKSGDEDEILNPQNIADGLMRGTRPRVMTVSESSGDDEDELLTDEERAKKREFAKHRKMHYNEFQAVKLARELIDDDEEDDEESSSVTPGTETGQVSDQASEQEENDASQTVSTTENTTTLSEDLGKTSGE